VTVTPSGGGAVAPYDEDLNVGLEDIGVGDIVLPRLRIVHDEAKFQDNLSNAEFESIEVILLGLVKQRIMWHPTVEEGDKPQCKSTDFDHGFPNVSDDTKKDKRFPWDKSNFSPEDFPPNPDFNNLVTLPCSSCIFNQWDQGDWKVPPCAEQHTYPLLYNTTPGEAPENQIWQPALLSVQKTGIKPSRQYISSFAQSKTAMFTVVTQIDLTLMKRGSVEYSVPKFKKLGSTDRNMWAEYADQLRQIRSFIRQPPRNEDDDYVAESSTESSSNVNTPPPAAAAAAASPAVAQPSAAPAQPAAAPQAAAAEPPDDSELPF
jgi:hypothetical protein